MNDLVEIMDGRPMVSSRVVAEKFGKSHADVLRAIDGVILKMETDSAIMLSDFFVTSTYQTGRGKTYRNIMLAKDGFALAAMGFTGKKALNWKLKYIYAFNKMESYVSNEQYDINHKINIVSKHIDGIKDAGSAWGKNGAAIRRKKKLAISELKELLSHAQLQLNF